MTSLAPTARPTAPTHMRRDGRLAQPVPPDRIVRPRSLTFRGARREQYGKHAAPRRREQWRLSMRELPSNWSASGSAGLMTDPSGIHPGAATGTPELGVPAGRQSCRRVASAAISAAIKSVHPVSWPGGNDAASAKSMNAATVITAQTPNGTALANPGCNPKLNCASVRQWQPQSRRPEPASRDHPSTHEERRAARARWLRRARYRGDADRDAAAFPARVQQHTLLRRR